MATEVKERSVPKPVFTDAEAGAQEFPSWQSRSYNYFTPRKRRATVYEDVTVDVQPDPERHLTPGLGLRVRQRRRRLPAGVVGAEVVQLARVPRSQRGVGADDLSQQRERRPPDLPEHRARPHGARLPGHEPRLGQGPRAPRVRVGARRARHRDARLHAGAARRADEHDQQRDGRRRGAQAALRAGPDPLQPRAVRGDRGLRRRDPQGRRGRRTRSGSRRASSSSA